MLNRKPVEVRYLKEEYCKSVIVPSVDKSRECTETKNGHKEKYTLVPAYIKVYSEMHPVMCIGVFLREYEGGSFYTMGYSVCSEDDEFSYETAREVAADRAYNRLCEITDPVQRLLPTELDLKRIPGQFREEFVDICTEFFKKYGNLV